VCAVRRFCRLCHSEARGQSGSGFFSASRFSGFLAACWGCSKFPSASSRRAGTGAPPLAFRLGLQKYELALIAHRPIRLPPPPQLATLALFLGFPPPSRCSCRTTDCSSHEMGFRSVPFLLVFWLLNKENCPPQHEGPHPYEPWKGQDAQESKQQQQQRKQETQTRYAYER
jgi:hypothetical protein